MKRLFLLVFVLCTLFCNVSFAQVINGDLNHNNALDVGDVTMVIDGYLTGEIEIIQAGGNPYMVDNSLVVGTWYNSSGESVTFNADGTTDFANSVSYEFLPTQGYILFYSAPDIPFYALRVLKATSDCLVVLPAGSSTPILYTATQPVSITLSQTSLEMHPDEYVRLTATVEPSGAGTVVWSSSDEDVATVVSGFVTAVGEGTAIIAAAVAGSTATCTVTVKSTSKYEAVDLSLSVRWATMNIGASAPEDYGDYFAWGETEPKVIYNWSTYTWCKGSSSTLTKYNTSSSHGTVDSKTVLELEDDAARANWGGDWRMPTMEEMTELIENCTWEWTTQNKVVGYKVTGPNGHSVFLPAAGYRWNDRRYGTGSSGRYWSSSLDPDYDSNACRLDFASGSTSWSHDYRYDGLSVRAVCP